MKTAYVSGYNPTTGEWNDSLANDHLWSSVNTREAVPDVMTPYTWSALRHSFDNMIMLPGYRPIGNICGRAYNNGSVGATAFRALGLKTFDAASSELYGVDSNSVGEWDVPYVPFDFKDRFLVLRNALKIMNTEEYILQYGHRGPHETEISSPRPAEDPNWIEEQIEGLGQSPSDVDALLAEQRARYEAALDRLRESSAQRIGSLRRP